MDSRAATEGGPYLGFVGAALRGGPALVRPIRSATIFCTSSYVAVSARNPSRATVLRLNAIAFGGMMIATNVFNNALKVDLDDYLFPFRKGGDMMTGLKGRVAVITGAAHGQGRAVALALAKEGVHVAALDVAKQLEYPRYSLATPAELESLAEAVTRFNVTCLPFAADVRDDSAVSRAIEETVQRLGRIDVLFNNAGICGYGLAHELTEEAWDAMLDINLKGAWLVARRVIPHMIRQKTGVIINNSSVMGLRGGARLSHYVASKWGLVGLTKSWAIELAPHNVRVVSIHPTGVNTPMNDGLAALEGLTPREIAERSAGNLLPVPWVEPEDVANAVVFLASEQARFVTGSQFVLDAGLLTR
jgi:SDR family mycofactocin-dependent oxidoreductase